MSSLFKFTLSIFNNKNVKNKAKQKHDLSVSNTYTETVPILQFQYTLKTHSFLFLNVVILKLFYSVCREIFFYLKILFNIYS